MFYFTSAPPRPATATATTATTAPERKRNLLVIDLDDPDEESLRKAHSLAMKKLYARKGGRPKKIKSSPVADGSAQTGAGSVPSATAPSA